VTITSSLANVYVPIVTRNFTASALQTLSVDDRAARPGLRAIRR
jgi:hypothetical protein